MSLERFLGARMVVQSPDTKVYDTVRAMRDNHIGAVLVHDGQSLVGIVTDRDLGLKVLELGLDPLESRLADVMTSPVASIGRESTVADAAALMIAQGVRRIPIVDGPTILGVVTLDDLILEHAVDAFLLAAIVRAQLAAAAKLKPAGYVHPARAAVAERVRETRHEERQWQTYTALIERTLESTGLASRDDAECALNTVLTGLLRRVMPDEAGDLLAQLPSRVRELAVRTVPAGPDLAVTRGFIERALSACLDIGSERAARVATQVAHVLEGSVSAGEMAQFKGQLPSDLRQLFDSVGPDAVRSR